MVELLSTIVFYNMLTLLCVIIVSIAPFVAAQGDVSNADLWACTEAMWAADVSSLSQSQFTYDLTANTPLFTFVNETALEGPTFSSLRALLQGFNPTLGEEDPELAAEIDAFLQALVATEPMSVLHGCLTDWGYVTGDLSAFTEYLRQWWFYKYSRSSGTLDSSGFEHVFQGGIDSASQTVSGFYGWVNAYYEEQGGAFIKTEEGQDCGDDLSGVYGIEWQGSTKFLSDMWLGKSPELEMGLLTACYLTRGLYSQNCNLEVNGGRAVRVISGSRAGVNVDTIGDAHFECGEGGPGPTNPPGVSTVDPPSGGLAQCSEAIWAADNNSFTSQELDYNLAGPDLFLYVDETRFGTGLYPAYIDLLEKFNPQLGEADPDLTVEIELFLDQLMATESMQAAYACLSEWGLVTDLEDLRNDVRQFWFLKYSRSDDKELCSSGFEHVFQGEVRENGNDVTGFHGWVNAYREEKAGNFIYGYSGDDCGDDLVQINDCGFYGANKPITSIWIGLSPEVQLSLMTMCFAVEKGSPCDIVVGGKQVTVINYTMSNVSPMTVGSAYFFC